jgi:hypothetical protein
MVRGLQSVAPQWRGRIVTYFGHAQARTVLAVLVLVLARVQQIVLTTVDLVMSRATRGRLNLLGASPRVVSASIFMGKLVAGVVEFAHFAEVVLPGVRISRRLPLSKLLHVTAARTLVSRGQSHGTKEQPQHLVPPPPLTLCMLIGAGWMPARMWSTRAQTPQARRKALIENHKRVADVRGSVLVHRACRKSAGAVTKTYPAPPTMSACFVSGFIFRRPLSLVYGRSDMTTCLVDARSMLRVGPTRHSRFEGFASCQERDERAVRAPTSWRERRKATA